MMFLKIMGSENLFDHDPSKPHTILSVSEYEANQDETGALFISYWQGESRHIRRVFSNIYVMNADGKTINSIAPPPGVPQ
jgi:hypothetical protein